MKLLIITREQAEMMDSDPINSIKLIILLIAIVYLFSSNVLRYVKIGYR